MSVETVKKSKRKYGIFNCASDCQRNYDFPETEFPSQPQNCVLNQKLRAHHSQVIEFIQDAFHFMHLVQATIFLSCAQLRVNMKV